ncbi:MAG: TSUP family transporter [Christensenellales bacterium]
MKEKLDAKKIVIGSVGGLFVGFLSGFFGGGGGMIVVPLLIFALGLPEKNAHATAILTILPISIASSVVYIASGSVNYLQLLYATIGFVIGGALGALLLKKLNNTALRIIFSLIMIAAGIKMIF